MDRQLRGGQALSFRGLIGCGIVQATCPSAQRLSQTVIPGSKGERDDRIAAGEASRQRRLRRRYSYPFGRPCGDRLEEEFARLINVSAPPSHA